jgi:hypothetical protein
MSNADWERFAAVGGLDQFRSTVDTGNMCARCHRNPAAGYAKGIDGRRLCHPDPALRPDETGPDCYHLTQGGRIAEGEA